VVAVHVDTAGYPIPIRAPLPGYANPSGVPGVGFISPYGRHWTGGARDAARLTRLRAGSRCSTPKHAAHGLNDLSRSTVLGAGGRRRVKRRGTAAAALAVLLVCLTALLAAASAAGAAASPAGDPGERHKHEDTASGTYTPLHQVPPTAQVVTVGTFWVNITAIDFQADTCYLTVYVWFAWRGDTDPTLSLEFANAVEARQLKMTTAFPEPLELQDGSRYQEMRVNGLFYQDYDLRRYPLDTQAIALDLEDGRRAMDEVVFIADRERSGIDAHVNIPGWNIMGLWSQSFAHDYGSTFHNPIAKHEATRFSTLKFTVEIEHNVDYFLWNLLFPLVVVMLTNWLALVLRPNWIDMRTGMPATALLTAVLLQIAYSGDLPELSYLVLMDKIYVMAYGMIIGTLLEVIWGNHRLKQHQLETTHEVRRLDVTSAAVQFTFFWAVIAYLIFSR